MKTIKIIFAFAILALSVETLEAQVFSPQLQGYFGYNSIIYSYGYYQGPISNGYAHGTGTFYFRDGTIFQGNFINGFRTGPGMLAVPYRGYITGCWSQNMYVGQCQQGNPYNSTNAVRSNVDEAVSEHSEEVDWSAQSPDGYVIERISPDTQLGGQLLGRYGGN